MRVSDGNALHRLELYMLEKLLSIGTGDLKTSSELQPSQLKPVPPEALDPSKHPNLTFSDEFFMHHIDKFFNFELNVVVHAIDDEFDRFLTNQKHQDDEFQRQLEDLDDMMLQDNQNKESPRDDLNEREEEESPIKK